MKSLKVILEFAVIVGSIEAITVPVLHYHKLQEVKKEESTPIPIVKHEYHRDKHGYHYSFESGNGIHSEEMGYVKNKGDKEHEAVVQQGSVTYHDEHGKPIVLTYIADENGFQPQGAHLPTAPPVPPEIQKALDSVPSVEPEQEPLQEPIQEENQQKVQPPETENRRLEYGHRVYY